jgi:hypothetical protein
MTLFGRLTCKKPKNTMKYRTPPLPTSERARATEELITRNATDLSRWSEIDSLATQWDARAALAADWIPADVRVLDVGCGAMALGNVLKPGCSYFPADLVKRGAGCFVVDLNRKQFPPGQYDWVSFLGVLEYVHEINWPLECARKAAPNLLVTYCSYTEGAIALRRGMGWVNDLTAPQFEAALTASGWRILRQRQVKRGPTNIQLMYANERAA